MPDLQIRLVDVDRWHTLLKMTLNEMIDGMEKRSLRDTRPDENPHLSRSFTTDLEGDLLQWTDKWSKELGDGQIFDELSTAVDRKMLGIEDACEPLSILSQWCSVGDWAAWEARVLLYVEPHLDSPLKDAEELYRKQVWDTALDRIGRMDKASYVESVVLDWMERRKSLGETMDETKDPMILSTMQAHERSSNRPMRTSRASMVVLVPRIWRGRSGRSAPAKSSSLAGIIGKLAFNQLRCPCPFCCIHFILLSSRFGTIRSQHCTSEF